MDVPTLSSANSSGQGRTTQSAAAFRLDLSVPAVPDSLALVRQIVGCTGRGIGLGPGAVADLRLALTETCSSAIRRGDGTSSIELSARADDGVLRVTIRDSGPAPAPGEGALPLPLVAAITDAIELTQLDDGGTEIAMSFRLDG